MMHYDINVCCTTHFTGLLFQPLCKARFGNVHSAWSSIEKIVRECVFTFEPFFIEYSEPFVAFCILIWDYKIFAFTNTSVIFLAAPRSRVFNPLKI